MDSNGTIEVAALGRPFSVGMLYDCRKDSLIPGITLWDHNDLKKDIGERPQSYNDFEIIASDSMEEKSSALNVEASLKASFLCGLIEVGGSAKYLNDRKTSKNQVQVTLKYEATAKFRELSMNHLGRNNVKHPYIFDQGLATHVVTGILYGARAFFVFKRDVSENESHQDIQGKMSMMIKKIPLISIEGEGSLKMEDKEKAKDDTFSCRFFGDFCLGTTPTNFQQAIKVYQSLPGLLGTSGENAVPMKVWMFPLTLLDCKAAKLVRQISVGLVQEAQRVLEDFSELEMRWTDALRTSAAQQFPQIAEKLKRFRDMSSVIKLGFQQDLAEKLPSIRGGGAEEAELIEILVRRLSSPFNSKGLNQWMDCKEREIYTLMSLTEKMKNIKIIPSQSHLYQEALSSDHVVCLVFTALGRDEPYLSALSKHLKGTKPEDQDPYIHDVEEEQWYASSRVAEEIRKQVKLFSDFSEANQDNKNIWFLAVGLTDENYKGSTIYLYKEGFCVSENFEPPSKPETVTAADINHNSVTLKISPPRFGAENITSYSVEFCVSGEDGWKQKTEPAAEEVTVSDLKPNTEYVFRCRAETSAGVGPAHVVSDPIRTLPCSPPGKPQVEPNSHDGSVSWKKPAELGPDVQILRYILEYRETDEQKDLQWKQMRTTEEEGVIPGLQPETEYVVRVSCDCGEAGRSKGSETAHFHTNTFTRPAELLKRLSEKIASGAPSVYKLPLTEEDINIKGCRKFNLGEENGKPNRSIILLGEAGSGKSTLINGMINYIAGVEWEDSFRFKLIDEDQLMSEAQRQASEVTVYQIYHQQGFRVDYSLTVIDAPGIGDYITRKRTVDSEAHGCIVLPNGSIERKLTENIISAAGIERDIQIIDSFCNLLSSQHSVPAVSAVCLVAQPDSAQLSLRQRLLFGSVLSNLGKDVSENLRILVTSESQRPSVLEAIKASGVPCPETEDGLPVHFKFNNSALFVRNKPSDEDGMSGDDEEEEINYDWMFWKIGTKTMKQFFAAMSLIDTKSLTLTKRVIREKEELKDLVDHLEKQVKLGLDKRDEINRLRESVPRNSSNIIDVFLKYYSLRYTVSRLVENYKSHLDTLGEMALMEDSLFSSENINQLIEAEKKEAKENWRCQVQYLIKMKEKAEIIHKVKLGIQLLPD